MSNKLLRIRELFKAQAKEFYRDFGAVFLSVVFPLFFVVVLVTTNLIAPTFKLEFGIVDAFRNPDARRLVEALSSYSVSVRSVTDEQAASELKEGKLQAVVIVPKGDMERGEGQIELVVNARYQQLARIVFDAARAQLLHVGQADSGTYPFRVNIPESKIDSNFAFLFPGMLALALLQLGLFATATPLLRARESGTLRHLLLTPLEVHKLLASQIGLRFVIAIAQITLLLTAGTFVLDLSIMDWLAVFGWSFLA